MHRKICSTGNRRGVSMLVDVLKKLNLLRGSESDVKFGDENSKIIIESLKKKKYLERVGKNFVSQVNDVIKKYRPALKKLDRK